MRRAFARLLAGGIPEDAMRGPDTTATTGHLNSAPETNVPCLVSPAGIAGPAARPESTNSAAESEPAPRAAKSGRGTSKSSRRRLRAGRNELPRPEAATDQTASAAVPQPSTCSSKANPAGAQVEPPSRYTRVAELGRGGWGVVERAVDHQLQREVAVKRLGANIGGNAEIRNRFLHEAKVTSQLQHPSIVPVHELGTGGQGEAFYVMKLLEGRTLRDHIRGAHQALGQPRTLKSYQLREAYLPLLDRFIDVCHAVAYAHRRGIIHRDLKPANVMVGEFGETVVVDWGLAKHLDQPSETRVETRAEGTLDPYETLGTTASVERRPVAGSQSYEVTLSGSVIGTPAYMPPEQAAGKVEALSPQSDIYALGVMLFEIVSGKVPLVGCDAETMLVRVCNGEVPRLRRLQPAAPRALEAVCSVAMAHDPGERYATAEQLAEDVRRFIAGDAVSVYRDPWHDRLIRWCRRHKAIALAISTSLCVLLIASLVFGGIIHRAHQAEQQARIEAQTAHRAAIGRLAQARDSADSWLLDLSGALEFYPGLSPLRDDLLHKAIAQYSALADEDMAESALRSSDLRLRAHAMLEAARAKIRLGDLHRIGTLPSEPPRNPQRFYQDARSLLAAATKELQQAGDGPPLDDVSAEIRLEQINALIGCALLSNRDVAKSASDSLGLDSRDPDTSLLHAELVQLESWLRAELPPMSRRTDAENMPADEFNHVSQRAYKLASAYIRLNLAVGRTTSGEADAQSGGNTRVDNPYPGNASTQVDYFRRAANWARWLADQRGSVADLRLAETTLTGLANALDASAASSEALKVRQELLDDLARWTRDQPDRADLLQSLAYTKMNQAEQLAHVRQDVGASRLYRDAIGDLTKAWELLDAESFFRINLAVANHNLAQLAAAAAARNPAQLHAAQNQLALSITTYQTLLQQEVTEDGLRRLCQAHVSMAELLTLTAADPADESEHWNSAELGYQMLVDHRLATHADEIEMAACGVGLADLGLKSGNESDAKICLERAAAIIERANRQPSSSSFRDVEVKLRWLDVSAKLCDRLGEVARAAALRSDYRDVLLAAATRERDASKSAEYPIAMQRWVDYLIEKDSQTSNQEIFEEATRWQQWIDDLHPECRQSAEWWQREATRCIAAGRFDEARAALDQCQQLRDAGLLDATLLLLLDARQGLELDPNRVQQVREALEMVPNHHRLHFWYAQLSP